MTISPWRWAHLWLAIVLGLFLIVASLTGAILSAEPIYEGSKGYHIDGAEELSIAALTTTLTSKYPELLSISRDANGFIQVQAFGDEGEINCYVNPYTGNPIGKPFETPIIFEFSRTLHRSLFFGKFGRFLVGFASLLLMVIAVSGVVLVAKKQGGLANYFNKIVKEDFDQDYHTRLGKVFVLFILAISLTGTYLFLARFGVIKTNSQEHTYDFDALKESPGLPRAEFPVFKTYHVAELKELVFPFSGFVDDLFELKLTNKELLINQITGEVVSEIQYPPTKKMSLLAFSWHTAEGQPWWAFLLGTSSLSLLFFMFTGFKVSLKRTTKQAVITNPVSKEKARIIIGYGSEMGSTLLFAKAVHEALLRKGQLSYLLSLNDFEYLPQMEQLLVFTSTYGTGGPPGNATQFLSKLEKEKQNTAPFQYAVLGFGSTKYHDYCQYAMEVDKSLDTNPIAKRLMALSTVDNAATRDFQKWITTYKKATKLELSVEYKEPAPPQIIIKVIKKRYSPNENDQTFLIKFRAPKNQLKHYQSGDLLVIIPELDQVERYYSMSVDRKAKQVALSVKRHQHGLVSNDLSQLNENDMINVSFRKNESFHFPTTAKHVIMIANGTGIAPFLGMIAENKKQVPISLFWGGQNDASYQLYRSDLYYWIEKGRLREVKTAFSRMDENPRYVQDLLLTDKSLLIQTLAEENTIMICGGLKMKEGVDALLADLGRTHFNRSLEYFYERGVIKSDCY